MLASGAPGKRLFVIDDDEVMCDLLSTVLEVHGYHVTAFSSGEAAIAAMGSTPPPFALLTDLQMPGLTGTELIRQLRAAVPSEVLLIGMSASAPSPEVSTALDAFLSKPFEIEAFESILDAESQSDPADAPEPFPAESPSPTEPEPVLDPAIVSALSRTLNPGQLRELYQLTLNDIGKRYARILESAAHSDLSAVHREAHAIKGSCGMVGARELQFLAARLEGGTTVETSALSLFPAACDRLRRMLDQKF